MTLKFLGREFATVDALKGAYPAFATDDAVRAIRHGCETPLEVERFCWKRKNEGMARTLKAVRARTQVLNEKAARARKRGTRKPRKAAA